MMPYSRMPYSANRTIAGLCTAIVACASVAAASPSADPPAEDDLMLESLDQLLGTEDEAGADTRGTALSDDLLTDEDPNGASTMIAVVEDLHLVAQEFSEHAKVTGVAIRNMESAEQVLQKLYDEMARKNRQSDSQQKRQEQQEEQRPPPPSPGSGSGNSPGKGQNGDMIAEDIDDEGIGEVLLSDTAQWGELPERVRSALREGTTDVVSDEYREAHREYTRRIADENEGGTE